MRPDRSPSDQPARRGPERLLQGLLMTGALVGMLALAVSCGGGGGGGDLTANPTNPTNPTTTTATVSGKISDSSTGSAIGGATVTDGTASTTSGTDGSYSLTVDPGARKRISVVAAGYAETQQIVSASAGGTPKVNVALLPATVLQVSDLSADTTLSVPGSPAQVLLPANSLVTSSGSAPQMPVTARLTPIDPSNNPQLMPGDYTTSLGETLQSYGALDATFTDSQGQALNLASGQTALIRIPLASAYWFSSAPATMPAYYYDTAAGNWVQEGTLALGGDGVDQYYVGSVAHFTTWNADNVAQTAQITGKVVRIDGSAVGGAQVVATGTSYIGTSSVTSADDGTFTLSVMQGQTFQVTATLQYLSTGTPILTVTNPNCALNGTFTNNDFWTTGTGWTLNPSTSGGTATHVSGTVGALSGSAVGLVSGTSYNVTYTISGASGTGGIKASLGGIAGTTHSTNGTYTDTIACGSALPTLLNAPNTDLVFTPSATTYGCTISNVSILPVTAPAAQNVGNLVIDGVLTLTGTIRDFSPSAPYQFVTGVPTNGGFTSDTGWTKGTGWTIAGNQATCGTHSGTSVLSQAEPKLVAGRSYPVTYTVTLTAGSITPSLGGANGTTRSASGTYTDNITCGTTTPLTLQFNANGTFRGSITNVAVRPPLLYVTVSTPFPEYTGDALLGSSDGPWWNPDFERSDAYPSGHTGIVQTQLGANNKPVFTGLAYASSTVHSSDSFNAWWTDFPAPHGPASALNTAPYQGLYTIPLKEQLPSTDPPTYVYDNSAQFPIDNMYQGNYIYNNTGAASGAQGTPATDSDDGGKINHNFHYTYELHLTFTYKVGQVFNFIGDDDVYVFINKLLVIDLGGVHSSESGTVTLNANTTATDGVTKLNLVDGQSYQFDFFYCERHTTASHMKITTSIPLNDSPIPN